MVERKEYLKQLMCWKDEQVIKVVTGIRRCGKSTLLAQYQDWLKANGVSDTQIVSVNFEELEYEELLDYKKLYAYLKERLVPGKATYIFLDEIQKVSGFEKVVDSLYVKPDVDIYITGSNAYLLCVAADCPMSPEWNERQKKWKPIWRVFIIPSLSGILRIGRFARKVSRPGGKSRILHC